MTSRPNKNLGQCAMVLAAGLGHRMRPLTLTRPKPLIDVAGRPLIAHAFEALHKADVKTAVVNVHYLAEQIEDWCAGVSAPRIVISDERQALLETGGGIAKALPLLGPDPFFVLNGDGFWLDDAEPALKRLRQRWRDAEMDCLLLVIGLSNATGFDGKGDFVMDDKGVLQRCRTAAGSPLAYIGGYLVHPRLFRHAPSGAFSMNVLWDIAIAQNRLFGLEHHGHWLHVGTPEAVGLAESLLAQRKT